MAVDWLHALSLGVFKTWASYAVHALIGCNAFRMYGNAPDRLTASVTFLRNRLFDFYSDESRRGIDLARVGDLTESMIGSDPTVVLGTHGAETNGFVKFLVQIILPRYGSALPPADFDQFMRGGRALIEMMRIIGEHTSGVAPPHEIQTFVEATCTHLTSLGALEIPQSRIITL